MQAINLDYLKDSRDRAILGSTPTLMQPLYGELPPVDHYRHRFVLARDGLYLQARTPALSVCLRVTGEVLCPFPYGELQESVQLTAGKIPYSLYMEMSKRALAANPTEYACLALYDKDNNEYRLHEPGVVSASPGHIDFTTGGYDPESVVLDLHTHGEGEAFFSPTDDHSDGQGGIYFASVLGRCQSSETMTAATRIVVNGIFYPVPWTPWELAPRDIAGAL